MISAYIFEHWRCIKNRRGLNIRAHALTTHMSISAPVTGIINYAVLIAMGIKEDTKCRDRDMLKHTQQWFGPRASHVDYFYRFVEF